MLSRSFSKKELIMVLLVLAMVLGFCYYYFVYLPVNDKIESANSRITELQDEDQLLQTKLLRLKKTQSELEALKSGEEVSIMPSYNGAKLEVNFLHDLMAPLGKYDFQFSEVTREKDLIRRDFTLSFESVKYDRIINIFKALYNCKYRVLISDVTYKAPDPTQSNSAEDNELKMSLSGTFYETMVGGSEDEGLPEDEAAKKAAQEAQAASEAE